MIREQEQRHREPTPDADFADSRSALATGALGRIGSDGNPEVVAILAGLLEARDGSIQFAAALELERLGPKARPAVPALVKALKSPIQGVRFQSSQALGKIGNLDARTIMPALIAALDDEDRHVRTHAAQALAAYGAEAKAAVPKMVRLLWEFGPEFEVARSLGRIGPDAALAVPPLLFYLDVTEPPERDQTREAIDRIMPRTAGVTVAGSIAALKAGDPAARARAAYELGRLIEAGPPPGEGVDALGEALGHPSPLVRQMAAAMLCRLGPRAAPAGPALIRAARDPDESVVRLITVALSRAAAELPGAIPALAELMKHRSGEVRRWAAGALAWAGPRGAPGVPAMIAGLEGQDIPTRASILAALSKLVPWHEAIVPALFKAFDDPSDQVRMAAVNALGAHVNVRRDVVMPALLRAMDDPSQGVRFEAGSSLGRIRPAGIVLPTLIEKLKEGKPNTRQAAVGAGGSCATRDLDPEVARRTVEALAAALADRDPEVRSSAASCLKTFGAAAGSAVPALRAAMNDPDRRVRDNASDALQWIATCESAGSSKRLMPRAAPSPAATSPAT